MSKSCQIMQESCPNGVKHVGSVGPNDRDAVAEGCEMYWAGAPLAPAHHDQDQGSRAPDLRQPVFSTARSLTHHSLRTKAAVFVKAWLVGPRN